MPKFELTVLLTQYINPKGYAESLGHAQIMVYELDSVKDPIPIRTIFYTPPPLFEVPPNIEAVPMADAKEIRDYIREHIEELGGRFSKCSYSVSYSDDRDAGCGLPSVVQAIHKKMAEAQERGDGVAKESKTGEPARKTSCTVLRTGEIDKSLEDFQAEMSERFLEKDFSLELYNCADAVNYTLNYFFPPYNLENLPTECTWKARKAAETLLCVPNFFLSKGTCTMVPVVTTSLCTTSPRDLASKVEALGRIHGRAVTDNDDLHNKRSKGPSHQQMMDDKSPSAEQVHDDKNPSTQQVSSEFRKK